MFDDPKLIRHLVVEALMDPSQEFDGCRAGQGAYAMHLIDGPLNDDVRPGLQGERAGFFLKFGCAVRMQPKSQPGGFPLNVDRKVCQFCRNMRLEEAGFDPGGRF
jgi:hypothetical protein